MRRTAFPVAVDVEASAAATAVPLFAAPLAPLAFFAVALVAETAASAVAFAKLCQHLASWTRRWKSQTCSLGFLW